MDLELRCWVPHPELSGRGTDSLNTAIYKELTRLEIEIPLCQTGPLYQRIPDSLDSMAAIRVVDAIRITEGI